MCVCVCMTEWKGWGKDEKEGTIKTGKERVWEDIGGGKSGKVETGMEEVMKSIFDTWKWTLERRSERD